jgi:hypothetical protein
MDDWSAVEVCGGWEAALPAESRLLDENAALVARLQRLHPALTRMAEDLALARRENAALRRENQRLRALAAADQDGGVRATGVPR